MSQEQLAADAEIPYSSVNEIESGKTNPTIASLMALAHLLCQFKCHVDKGNEICQPTKPKLSARTTLSPWIDFVKKLAAIDCLPK